MTPPNWTDKSCKETVWLTPETLLTPVRNYFGGTIPLDPATETANPTKADIFYTATDNGLQQPWDTGVFVNPPYGKGIRDWCSKIHAEAIRKPKRPILALLPCGSGRPGTIYWQDHIFQKHLTAICFVRGRLKFLRADGTVAGNNTYPSHLLGFNVKNSHFISCFKHLGKILQVKVVNC